MSRGGKRAGAGRKKSIDPSVTIRVPTSMKQSVKEWITVKNGFISRDQKVHERVTRSIGLLESALHLKANAGGKIKSEIRKAIALLQEVKI